MQPNHSQSPSKPTSKQPQTKNTHPTTLIRSSNTNQTWTHHSARGKMPAELRAASFRPPIRPRTIQLRHFPNQSFQLIPERSKALVTPFPFIHLFANICISYPARTISPIAKDKKKQWRDSTPYGCFSVSRYLRSLPRRTSLANMAFRI